MTDLDLAKQAGLIKPYGSDHEGLKDFDWRKFAELVRAAEREACGELINSMTTQIHGYDKYEYAEAIRARSEK